MAHSTLSEFVYDCIRTPSLNPFFDPFEKISEKYKSSAEDTDAFLRTRKVWYMIEEGALKPKDLTSLFDQAVSFFDESTKDEGRKKKMMQVFNDVFVVLADHGVTQNKDSRMGVVYLMSVVMRPENRAAFRTDYLRIEKLNDKEDFNGSSFTPSVSSRPSGPPEHHLLRNSPSPGASSLRRLFERK